MNTTRNRLILRLDAEQRKKLSQSGIGLAGLIAGGGLVSLFGPKKGMANESSAILYTEEEYCELKNLNNIHADQIAAVSIETELSVAEVSPELSFSEAFASARSEIGAGGFFEWQGNTYNTYYEEEWNALSDDEQTDFIVKVSDSTPLHFDTTADISTENQEDYLPVQETGNADVTHEEFQEEAVPIIGIADIDKNGFVDAISIDQNQDGFADVIAMDTTNDGMPDTYAADQDYDGNLDVLVFDEAQDGIDDQDYQEDMDAVVSMDDFIIIEDDEDIDEASLKFKEEASHYDQDTSLDHQDLDDYADPDINVI